MDPGDRSIRMRHEHEAPASLRIHGTIARDLGLLIVGGSYKQGDLLDGEIVASERLHVSRTAYREALRMLTAKGLVQSRPKTGTRVNPRENWHLLDPDVLSWIFQFEPEDDLVSGLFELRRIVEPEAAALAAERCTEDQLAKMAFALEGMATHTLASEAGRAADQDFHAALFAASGNPFMISLTAGVSAAVAWTTIFKQRSSPLQRDPIPDHQRVYDAVASRDTGGARVAMADLIDMALLDTLQSRPRNPCAAR